MASQVQIGVCALDDVAQMAERLQARSMVTLLSPGMRTERPPRIAPENHLILQLHDIAEATQGLRIAGAEDVSRLIAFGGAAAPDSPLLIHCWMGVSRSTAAAFILACQLDPATTEETHGRQLREIAPFATPNPRLIALADAQLGREGRMIRAIRAIGRGAECRTGTPFIWTIDACGSEKTRRTS